MSSFDLFGNPQKKSGLVDKKNKYSEPDFSFEVSETEEVVENGPPPTRNFTGLSFFILLSLTILGIQCFRLQIEQGQANQALAEGNSLRIITQQANRGLIVDANNDIIAQNTEQTALGIDPETLPSNLSAREAIYSKLQQKAGISSSMITFIESNRLKTPDIFAIKTNLTHDESLLYQEWFNHIPGVIMMSVPVRTYATLPSLGQLIGYVGQATASDVIAGVSPDQQVGRAGLEKVYNNILSGTPGKQKAEVNAYGQIVNSYPISPNDAPKNGDTLKLSLDPKLQNIVATALENGIAKRDAQYPNTKDYGASAVVLDPSNGAILAMVSLPDYNPNLFSQGISQADYSKLLNDPSNPLLNRAIQGQYPSGSVIKPLIAAGALQSGVITPNTQFNTQNPIVIGPYVFPDWTTHGISDVRKAIAQSNDIFFYSIGGGNPKIGITGMGIDSMNKYLSAFGLGKPLGVDLPGEVGGLLGNNAWKEQTFNQPWYVGDTYHSAIGQGYTLVTPLQMAASTAAVVNGGTLYQPQLAWSTIDPITGKETLLPHTILNKNFISAANMQVVREGMRDTVTMGSAQPLKTLTVTSAGKTGTAEFGTQNLTHAWYTGFAPYDNPKIVFSILIEAGGDSFYSSEPVAEEILRNYFNDPLAPGQQLNSASPASNPGYLNER
jgi:penicillin-binding protein 2